jgi:hypothetical protein
VDEGLQIRGPSSEAIHIPLEQIHEWRGTECTRKKNDATAP